MLRCIHCTPQAPKVRDIVPTHCLRRPFLQIRMREVPLCHREKKLQHYQGAPALFCRGKGLQKFEVTLLTHAAEKHGVVIAMRLKAPTQAVPPLSRLKTWR